MHQERIIIQTDKSPCSQLSHSPCCSGRDHDGLECNPLKFLHSFVKGQPSSQKSPDLTRAPAEHGHIEVARPVNNILRTSSDQFEQLYHLLHALPEKGSLGIIVKSSDPAVSFFRKADSQRDTQGIGIFHCDSALDSQNIRGKADVIIISRQQSLDLLQSLHILPTERDMAVIVVSKFVAGTGTADRIEADVLPGGLTLFKNIGIGDQSAILQINHSLGDSQQRHFFREHRQNLIAKPVQAETADPAQDQIRPIQGLSQFLNLVIFDSVMKSPLQSNVIIVHTQPVDDFPVQGRSHQPYLMSVLKCRKCDRGIHLTRTNKCNNTHAFLLPDTHHLFFCLFKNISLYTSFC